MSNVYETLGFSEENGLIFLPDDKKINLFPDRISYVLTNIVKPDAIYTIDGRIVILFFQLTENSSEKQKKMIYSKCWNFNESPVVIISSPNGTFEIYNGFKYIAKTHSLAKLDEKSVDYLSIASGQIWKTLKEDFAPSSRVDSKLLNNIKHAREKLIRNGLGQKISNLLIGRVIFFRYLIDRKIRISTPYGKKLITNDDLKRILSDRETAYEMFSHLKEQFNGDIFPIQKHESNVNITHLNILVELISGTEISSGQKSLFDVYDFSIIPIEFISNIYEYFIGKEEQESKGAYYTPTFLVDYILNNTIDCFFKENPDRTSCRILDPACGSGIFLVESLRKLISQHIKIRGVYESRESFKENIKNILKQNIYGIDKDADAIMVTVFSLCITLLDYQNPKDIEDFKFPNILNTNFFEADFFDEENLFNDIFEKHKPDIILGNPPYKRGASNSKPALKYIRGKNKEKIFINNKEIAQAFIVRSADFSDKNTLIAFVVTSKILYNTQSLKFRKSLLENFLIKRILELSSVRMEIFDKSNDPAVTPVSIIFYKKSSSMKDVLKNNFTHVSVKPHQSFSAIKMLGIQKNDIKVVHQLKLIKYDWLWKVLTYGSSMDMEFLLRLKSYNTIHEVIDEKSVGISVNGGDKNDASMYKGIPKITTKNLEQDSLLFESLPTWNTDVVHRAKKMSLFEGHKLLVAKGVSKNLKFKHKIFDRTVIFTDSITCIKAKNNILKQINDILDSDFARYFIFHISSSVGIEREQVHSEKFDIPYIPTNNKFSELEIYLIDYVKSILMPWIMKKKYSVVFRRVSIESNIINRYVNTYIETFKTMYEKSQQGIGIEVMHTEHILGFYFKVVPIEESGVISFTKDIPLDNFIKISGENLTEKLFIQHDVKGFEKDGFYIIKPNEYKNWHPAIGYQDAWEFKDAILRTGTKR